MSRHGLRDKDHGQGVSILVLMESSLCLPPEMIKVELVPSFNPCFNGILSVSLLSPGIKSQRFPCFNPCFNGILSVSDLVHGLS